MCFISKNSASDHGIHVDEVVQRLGLPANKIKYAYAPIFLSQIHKDTWVGTHSIIFTDLLIVDNDAGKQSITMWMWVIFTQQLMTSTSNLHVLTDIISNIYAITSV
jgi:hypothetical protein